MKSEKLTLAQKINNKLENISEWVWEEIMDKQLIPIYKNNKYTGEMKKRINFYIIGYTLQFPLDFILKIYWRVFIRGYCALKGCKIVYYNNWNLPDDCHEWACERCWCEGINHINNTRYEPFYNDTPTRNFCSALKGD